MFLVWQLFTRAVSAGILLRTGPKKREHVLSDLHFRAIEGHLVLAVFCVSWEDKAVSSYQVFKTFAKYGTDCFNAFIPSFFLYFFFNQKHYCTFYKYIKKKKKKEGEKEKILFCAWIVPSCGCSGTALNVRTLWHRSWYTTLFSLILASILMEILQCDRRQTTLKF